MSNGASPSSSSYKLTPPELLALARDSSYLSPLYTFRSQAAASAPSAAAGLRARAALKAASDEFDDMSKRATGG